MVIVTNFEGVKIVFSLLIDNNEKNSEAQNLISSKPLESGSI